jgi:hypothetical protein
MRSGSPNGEVADDEVGVPDEETRVADGRETLDDVD